MKYEKYIVPIFTSDESKTTPSENDFNGNGVIIGKHFITAAHVVKRDKTTDQLFTNVWFKFDEKFYKLTNPVYFEYDKNVKAIDKNTFCKLDLSIYAIDETIKSPIDFIENQSEYLDCYYYGYSMNEDNKQLNYDIALSPKVYAKTTERRGGNPYVIENCFRYDTKYPLTKGNSGGAIFHDNKFVGLLVSVAENEQYIPIWYRCISAKYINEKIKHLCHS
jgi:hypothetical protein